ncbi:MAG: sulfite exporter TauE/SafE family protein [Solirubrobacteraceae bacterium]|nr:sulfite exporter TauE/SafE family protein [Solirubrobacteraceae bacterium]
MTLLEALAVTLAGVAAGTINVVVGSGTLITFPALLAVGYSPVVANVTNSLGLVPGSVAGSIGYRRELAGQRRRMTRLLPASLLGGTTGALLLLVLPDDTFRSIVPVFIVAALVVIVLQPQVSQWVARHRPHGAEHTRLVPVLVFLSGLYGGYFGAAQGILLMAILGTAIPDDLQRLNALKNVLAGAVNLIAGLIFAAIADVAWGPAALIALGSTLGGVLGARYGRRLSPGALRAVIVAVGVFALVRLIVG